MFYYHRVWQVRRVLRRELAARSRNARTAAVAAGRARGLSRWAPTAILRLATCCVPARTRRSECDDARSRFLECRADWLDDARSDGASEESPRPAAGAAREIGGAAAEPEATAVRAAAAREAEMLAASAAAD